MGRERGQSHEVTHAGTARPISYGSQQQAAAAKGRQPAAGSEPHLRRRPRSPTTVSYFSGKRLTIVSWMQAACAASTTCRQARGREASKYAIVNGGVVEQHLRQARGREASKLASSWR